MTKSITNYELRITLWKLYFQSAVFLCLIFISFAGNGLAQSFESFSETIRRGTVEQKRDALFQIRNLENAEASRIAVPALNDKSEIVRATAAFSVVFLPNDEALTVLLPLLNDKKELVRREASYALGKVGSQGAINSLLRILQSDKVLDVRAASVIALGEISDASVVPELVKILQRKPKTEEEFLRRSAARSIGQIAQTIQIGSGKVNTPENFLPDELNLIAKPKYPNLIEVFPAFQTANQILIEILQNPSEADDVKRETAFALGAIGDKTAIPILRTNLDAEDYYLARISAEALRKISASTN